MEETHVAQKKLQKCLLKSFNKTILKLRASTTPNQDTHALICLFKKCSGKVFRIKNIVQKIIPLLFLPILVKCSLPNRLEAKRGAESLLAPHQEQARISFCF